MTRDKDRGRRRTVDKPHKRTVRLDECTEQELALELDILEMEFSPFALQAIRHYLGLASMPPPHGCSCSRPPAPDESGPDDDGTHGTTDER